MNLKKASALPTHARVMEGEYKGWEFEIEAIFLSNDKIDFAGLKETFYLHQVRLLTPVEFKGKKIAIGDEVKAYVGTCHDWYTVYGYHWYDGGYKLNMACQNDFKDGCYTYYEANITAHRTGLEDTKVEDAIKVLEDAGKIKDGKIII